jgi:hypothetical protein
LLKAEEQGSNDNAHFVGYFELEGQFMRGFPPLLLLLIACCTGLVNARESENQGEQRSGHYRHQGCVTAGTALGMEFYWDNGRFVPDTASANVFCGGTGLDSGCGGSLSENFMRLCRAGKTVYRVKYLSSICAGMLCGLGYRLFCVTQLQATTPENIKVNAPGLGETFQYQTAFSDYVVEEISSAVLTKQPAISGIDYKIKLCFGREGNGYCTYAGRDDVGAERSEIMGTSDGIGLRFLGNTGSASLKITRRILSVYLLADKSLKSSKIEEGLEDEMDKIKLDISYKPPELLEQHYSK